MNRIKQLISPVSYGTTADLGLLILRAGVGLIMMMSHGWPKLSSFGEKSGDFYDFMGFGPAFSLGLTVFAEFFCSLFLVLGMGTRLFLVPLIILSLVIVFVIHGPDPFGDKESGLLFLIPYLTLLLTGAGKYSLDYLLWKKP